MSLKILLIEDYHCISRGSQLKPRVPNMVGMGVGGGWVWDYKRVLQNKASVKRIPLATPYLSEQRLLYRFLDLGTYIPTQPVEPNVLC